MKQITHKPQTELIIIIIIVPEWHFFYDLWVPLKSREREKLIFSYISRKWGKFRWKREKINALQIFFLLIILHVASFICTLKWPIAQNVKWKLCHISRKEIKIYVAGVHNGTVCHLSLLLKLFLLCILQLRVFTLEGESQAARHCW